MFQVRKINEITYRDLVLLEKNIIIKHACMSTNRGLSGEGKKNPNRSGKGRLCSYLVLQVQDVRPE